MAKPSLPLRRGRPGGRKSSAPARPRDGVRIVAPERGELRHLVFHRLDRRPDQVDLVYVYRPAAELYGILVTHAVPLGAPALWLQPPLSGAEANLLTRASGPEV